MLFSSAMASNEENYPGPEVCQGGDRHQQRRPLRPPLTHHRRRSGDDPGWRGDDQLHSGDRRLFRHHFHHRLQYGGVPPAGGVAGDQGPGARAKLIVADPRRTEMANKADIWLRVPAGYNIPLINALIQVIIEEQLFNHSFVQEHTEGFADLARAVEDYAPAWWRI